MGIKPGTVRLQSQHFIVLQAVAQVLEPAAQQELSSLTGALVRAGQKDVGSVGAAAKTLAIWLDKRSAWSTKKFSDADVRNIRRMLLDYAAADKAGDFATAEQVVMGVASLSYSLQEQTSKKAALDALYAELKKDSDFNPTRFATVAKNAQRSF